MGFATLNPSYFSGKPRGCPVDMRDTFIAGIALARRATLATRNLRHFDDLSISVINPWDGA
jgi:toxin FitB